MHGHLGAEAYDADRIFHSEFLGNLLGKSQNLHICGSACALRQCLKVVAQCIFLANLEFQVNIKSASIKLLVHSKKKKIESRCN